MCWSTDELNNIEDTIIHMTYVDAFMYVTSKWDMSPLMAREWIKALAKKHPNSRLSKHAELTLAVWHEYVVDALR